MIPSKKLIDIVSRLLEKAKVGEVRWQPDPDFDGVGRKTFTVQFKESELYVQYVSPPTELDRIEIGIENGRGETISKVVAYEDDSDTTWNLFFELYQEADRAVIGSDRVLIEIEEELRKEGVIGADLTPSS